MDQLDANICLRFFFIRKLLLFPCEAHAQYVILFYDNDFDSKTILTRKILYVLDRPQVLVGILSQ